MLKTSLPRFKTIEPAQDYQLSNGSRFGIYEVEVPDDTNINNDLEILPKMIKNLYLHPHHPAGRMIKHEPAPPTSNHALNKK